MHTTQHLSEASEAFSALVDRLGHHDLSRRVASGAPVQDALEQIMVIAMTAAARLRGDDATSISRPPVYGWVPKAEFRDAMTELAEAASAPGATERTVAAAAGPIPGELYVDALVRGLVRHADELASSVGRRLELAPELRAASDPLLAVA